MTVWKEDLDVFSPFKNYGNGNSVFDNAKVIINSNGTVSLQGLVDFISPVVKGDVIAQFPSFNINIYQPTGTPQKTLLFTVHTRNGAVRIDVTPDGLIKYVDGPANSWISLSGITYYTTNVPDESYVR